MRLPDDPKKYTSRFKYIEVGRIIEDYKDVPGDTKFIREQHFVSKDERKPKLIDIKDLAAYAEVHNNTSIYRSVYQYDTDDFDKAVPLGPLYFDLDHKTNPRHAYDDAYKILMSLQRFIPEEAIDVYFSGSKGYHIEVEPIVLGVSASDDLPKVSSFIARRFEEELDLKSIDYQVYDIRRMWRVPNTKHRDTGLYKVECKDQIYSGELESVKIRAKHPSRLVQKPEQKFNAEANKWYREFTYQYEQSLIPKYSTGDLFSRFLEQGTGYVRHFSDDVHKKFDKYTVFKRCEAVRNLEKKAREQHHLEHYERLFLCSLLTYSDDAIKYLHETLQNCSDYSYEISNSHVEDWIKRREYDIGGRPFTCQKAKEVGISCSGCEHMEPKRKIINTGGGKYIESEEYASPSPIRFCYTTIKSEDIE